MSFLDRLRGDRDRTSRDRDQDRDQDRWRQAGSDPGRRADFYGERNEPWNEPRGEGFQRRGWRQGSDYYGDNPERYGAGNYDATGYEGQSFNDRWQNAYSGSSASSGHGGRTEGQFRGVGPKGYRRSDDRIREDVCERLTVDERIDASNMDVIVKDCEVILSGTVNSREEKRRAEDLIESLSGVKDVNNNLRVVYQSGLGQGSSDQDRQPGITQPGQTTPGARH